MPVEPTYPGVYVAEIPSGVRIIDGVATSITAFIGRAQRGPVDEATMINSYVDYVHHFGGLDLNSSMSFAVQDFFVNGGSTAIIVRLFHAEDGSNATSALAVGGVQLEARNPGSWGSLLRAEVDLNVSADVASSLGLSEADLFNLTITDTGQGGNTETFPNLSFKESSRRVDRVLASQSALVRWQGLYPATPLDVPMAGTDLVTGAELALDAANQLDPADEEAVAAAEMALLAAQQQISASDGLALTRADDFTPANARQNKSGLYALEQTDLFNMLCIPPYCETGGEPNCDVEAGLIGEAALYCETRRAILLVDSPSGWNSPTKALDQFSGSATDNVGTRSKNAALFFPRVEKPNPLRGDQIEDFAPCGAIAGLFARTDKTRGVWKAAAGPEAVLNGVETPAVRLTNNENGDLNPLGINCLRSFPGIGTIAWGSRTLISANDPANEWKYIPVRRTALFIEESLYRGIQWVIYEPNDERLWAQIRLNVGSFMGSLFREGAFQGSTASQAYFVKCDRETTTQNDIDQGVVNIVVGFAAVKQAEFVIIKLRQIVGQSDVVHQ